MIIVLLFVLPSEGTRMETHVVIWFALPGHSAMSVMVTLYESGNVNLLASAVWDRLELGGFRMISARPERKLPEYGDDSI